MSTVLRVNTPDVINETIDGESVMINLRTGAYYSLVGAGADVWDAIEQMASLEETIDALVGSYDVEPAVVRDDVLALVEELRLEGLVVTADRPSAHGLVVPRPASGPYERPTLAKFTDMQDLILLDPVHEVDHQVWPQEALSLEERS